MKNLRDNTFLIPIRIDSHVRLENVLLVTQFLIEHFDTNIKVLECAPYDNGLLEKLLDKTIQYSFQEDNDTILYRTKFINQMVRSTKTRFVAVWDADVIAPDDQIIKAVELLRTEGVDFVYPYEGQFLDTTYIIRKLYMQERNIDLLVQNMRKMKAMYNPNPVGGGFFANLETYNEAGLENENFYGWGPEDIERFERWESLGLNVKRIEGPLFHLSHGRGLNSSYRNTEQYYSNFREIGKSSRIRPLKTY